MTSMVPVYMEKRSSMGEPRGVKTCNVPAGDDAHIFDLEDLQDADTCHLKAASEDGCG